MNKVTMKMTGADYMAALFSDDPLRYKGQAEREIVRDLDDLDDYLADRDDVRLEMQRRGVR